MRKLMALPRDLIIGWGGDIPPHCPSLDAFATLSSALFNEPPPIFFAASDHDRH